MKVRPTVQDVATVVDAVTESVGQSLSLHSELDVDVYRLRRAEEGCDLVVRAFGPAVPRATVDAAARVLRGLAETRFPAERCATESPVLALDGGRHLLVTEYIDPLPPPSSGFVLAWCAALLGRLATRQGDGLLPGGGWHRLGVTPSEEIDEALRLGGEIGTSVAELADALADADDATGLPQALIHPDPTPPNAVAQGDDRPVIIDWIGVGQGPRIWPLAFLLFSAGPGGARQGLDRYSRSVSLGDEERQRLPGVMLARPLALDLWAVAHDRITARQAVTRWRANRARAAAVTAVLDDARHG